METDRVPPPARADAAGVSFWGDLKTRWSRGGTLADVLVLAGSRVVGQALVVASFPLFAALYTPGDYGAWVAFNSLALILSVVANWRYELAVVLPEKDPHAANVLALALLIAAAMAILALVLVAVLFNPLARLLADPNSASWLWAVPLFTLLIGVYQAGYYWGTRRKQFALLAVTDVSLSFTTVCFQIGAALAIGSSPSGLILGGLVGQGTAVGMLAAAICLRDGRLIRESIAWRDVYSCVAQYRTFPLYAAPFSFLNNLFQQLVFLLLARFGSLQILGLFGMAMRLMYFPNSLISGALGQVFYRKAATDLPAGTLEPFVLKVLKALALLVTPVLLFFCFHTNWIIDAVLGEAWAGVSTYVLFLAPPALALLLVNWLRGIYDVLGLQRLSLIMEVVYGVATVSLMSLALFVFKSPTLAVALFCAAFTVYNLVWVGMTFSVARFSMKGLWEMGFILLSLLAVGGAAGWVVQRVFASPLAILVDSVLLAVYYTFALWVWLPALRDHERLRWVPTVPHHPERTREVA